MKRKIFQRSKVKATQDAIKRRFGRFDGVDIREDGDHIRIIEKNPVPKELHVRAEFHEREENGEKLTGLSFSSELPVIVYGEPEILIHDSEAANFSRLLEVGAILKNHNPGEIIGVPVKAWIDDKRRGNLLMRWGTTEIALNTKKEALEDKTLRGVSVGYAVKEWVYLRDKTEIYKNITGPAWVAVKWDALEASLTPVPADPSVGLERMVREIRAETRNNKQEIIEMKKLKLLRAWKASDGKTYDEGAVLEVDERTFAELTEGDEPQAEAVTDAPEQRSINVVKAPETRKEPEAGSDADTLRREAVEAARAEMRAEAKRAADIRTICKRSGLAELADEMIAEGKTVEECQRAVLDKMIERQAQNTPQTGIEITRDGRDSFRSAVTDGLLLRSGMVNIEKPAEGASDFRGMTLMDMARECIRRTGSKVPGDIRAVVDMALNMRGSETIVGTTSDFPYILANTANKSLLEGFQAAPATYPFWARTGSLNDFKAASRIKFSEVGKLKLVEEGGKYTETARTEKRETIQLGTYAKKWTMSRQGIINDDIGAFTNTLFSFGMQSGLLPNDLAIAVLTNNAALSDGVELFAAGHGNYSAETDRRLDTLAHGTAALKHLMGLMAQQKTLQADSETDGARYLNLRPKVWLVAMTDELIARQVVVSAADASQDNPGVENPFRNLGL
ncbi:MAG: hypothetical protein WCY59_07240, partial [Anaerovoracaceae bacterium]